MAKERIVKIGDTKTMEELLIEKFPKQMTEWDGWQYKIYTPVSFVDHAEIIILLRNQSGKSQEVKLAIG